MSSAINLLASIPAGTPTEPYKNIQSLWRKIQTLAYDLAYHRSTNQLVAFTNVPAEQFEKFQNSTADTMKLTRWEYYKPTETLLVKVACFAEHAVATGFVRMFW
ncbi:hypothetical protein SI65_00986 [Aspergillus cristatus]|uniref:Uncharacterized protein n=1 Tax=Aspergillus cristatus TaxID=573508 RepID=A0A1E3BR72_ASPCR|nr:hypothetical protein SI65_00986 [Aspergillus cristatus]